MHPLKHKGVKSGTSLTNAQVAQKRVWHNKRLVQQFSFRAFMPVEANGVKDGADTSVFTRFVCHNFFRHKFSEMASARTSAGKLDWNSTLGVDASFIRKIPDSLLSSNPNVNPPQYGTWPFPPLSDGAVPLPIWSSSSKYDLNLISAMRTPLQNQYMYSLCTKQHLENCSWNLNPLKTRIASIPTAPLVVQPVYQYGNAPVAERNDLITSVNNGYATQSMPNRQNGFGNETESNQEYTYDVQLAGGSVHYTFANESTCPVIIDIVIHTIKKGQTVNCESVRGFNQQAPTPELDTNDNKGIDFIGETYKQGFKNMVTQKAGIGPLNLAGREPNEGDCLYDAKTPFMPASALKHIPSVRHNAPTYNPSYPNPPAYVGAPFKQAGRDQFIIAAGAQRSWSMPLCSESYSSQKFRQGRGAGNVQAVPWNNDIDIKDMVNFEGFVDPEILDEHAYALSFGFSSVATPLFEGSIDPTATVDPTVIDRSACGVNVRVTGSYKENIAPACLKHQSDMIFVDGQTVRPSYSHSGPTPPTFHANIANSTQCVRTSSPRSANIGVGSVNAHL